jgi:hypothetical protein
MERPSGTFHELVSMKFCEKGTAVAPADFSQFGDVLLIQ